MAVVTIGAIGNPFFNSYTAELNGSAGDTYKITGNFVPNGTGVNYSDVGTVTYSAGDNHFLITGAGARSDYQIAFSFQQSTSTSTTSTGTSTSTSGDPHVKPLDGDVYTL